MARCTPVEREHGRAGRHAASALMCTVVGVLPASLVGGLGPLIRADLGLPAWWIGVGMSISFGTAAVASVPGGRLADRIGSRRALWVGVALSVTALFGIGVLAQNRLVLGIFLGVGGVGNAIIQPAANLALARGVPATRRGLAFGVKQAAIPTATLLSGLSVPILGVAVGWRAAFVSGGVLALFAGALPARSETSRVSRVATRIRLLAPPSLWLLTLGIGCASGAANAMGAYLVESAIAVGWDPGTGGLFLGLGSATGIVSRLGVGWVTDHMTSGWLKLVAAMMAVGAVGFGCLAFLDVPALLVVGVTLGFAAGWGHNGLFLFAVVRLHPESPATATGMTQAGAFGGPVIGPPAFGLIATTASFAWAWGAAALTSALAALLILLAHRQVQRERTG